MIRRQRKVNVASDSAHQIQSGNGSINKEDVPTTFVTSAPTSNGYFHVDNSISSKQNDRYRRRRKTISSKEKYHLSRLRIAVVVGSIYCFCIVFYNLISYSRSKQKLHSSVLSCLKSNFTVIFQPQRFRLPTHKLAVPNTQSISAAYDEHDFGNLDLRFPEYKASPNFGRVIYHDKYEDTGYYDLWYAADDDGDIESYYAFDDDDKRNPLVMYDDPDIHLRKKCRRTNWHRQLPITCNAIHEFDFQSHLGMGDTRFVG